MKRQCEEKEQQLAVLKETLSAAQKEVTELRSCLREVERSRLEARRELQELRRQVRHAATCRPHQDRSSGSHASQLGLKSAVKFWGFPCWSDGAVILCFSWLQLKVLDVEKEQKGKEVAELQTRLSLEEQREEERGKDIFTLKQKLSEAETVRDSLKKEVMIDEGERDLQAASICCIMVFILVISVVAFLDSEASAGVWVRLAWLWERTDCSATRGTWLREETAGRSQEPVASCSGSSGLCRAVQPAAERGSGPTGRHRDRAGPCRGWKEGSGVSSEQPPVCTDSNAGHRSGRQRRQGQESRGELSIPWIYVTPPKHLSPPLLAVSSQR